MAYDVVRNRSHIWMVELPTSGAASMANARQVTRENERIEGMRISSSGAWLVYDADRGGNSDIYKLKLDGGAPIQITSDPANDFHPAWSPRDDEIVFYSSRGGDRDIFITTAEGGGERRITQGTWQDYYPNWSPDGRRIVFSRLDGRMLGSVYSTELLPGGAWSDPKILGGGELTFITAASARFSPDGKEYVGAIGLSGRGGQQQLVVGPVAGGAVRTVWQDSTARNALTSFVWGRDGRLYFNTIDGAGRYAIWSLAPSGGTPRLLLRDEPQRRLSRWDFDTDGRRLFFTLAADESDIWVVALKR
jgi:Tol biopolymer transport system component